ncbi:MAG: deoxyguanosinetriphosphate triphosphohydrolase [Mycobacteriales bacterium]
MPSDDAYSADDVARYVAESTKATDTRRSPFERDRARVLHSAAFRRLAAKTQVVGVGEWDFPRTRLTHSLECAQIGRELAAALGADPDLVDAACLAHDVGHPPFGHNGEIALDVAAQPCGGFEGNAQSFRVLVRLEAKVFGASGELAGLNLTRATLDGATKYPWPREVGRAKYGVYADDAPVFAWLRAGAPAARPSFEAQVMDWADDVAYSVHDFEDGVHSGLVKLGDLGDAAVLDELGELTATRYPAAAAHDARSAIEELLAMPWWLASYDGTARAQAALKRTTSELIARLCASVVTATQRASGGGPLRRYGAEVVVPADVRLECEALKALTARFVMGRSGAAALQQREREIVAQLVAVVADRSPDVLEPAFAETWRTGADDDRARLRIVVDQVASLTDISARAWHARLVST